MECRFYMRFFGFIMAVIGIPVAASLPDQHIGLLLIVLQIPNLIMGLMCIFMPEKYSWGCNFVRYRKRQLGR